MKNLIKIKILTTMLAVFILIIGLLIWYYNHPVLSLQFDTDDVQKITVDNAMDTIEPTEITDEATIEQIHNLYNTIQVKEKIDTYSESPGTPDIMMDIYLTNGDIIRIEDAGMLFVQGSHITDTGRSNSNRYGFICSQPKLLEYMYRIAK